LIYKLFSYSVRFLNNTIRYFDKT